MSKYFSIQIPDEAFDMYLDGQNRKVRFLNADEIVQEGDYVSPYKAFSVLEPFAFNPASCQWIRAYGIRENVYNMVFKNQGRLCLRIVEPESKEKIQDVKPEKEVKMNKTLEEHTFDELVEKATIRIHSALLEEGSKGMKSAIYQSMQESILWRLAILAKDKKENQQ